MSVTTESLALQAQLDAQLQTVTDAQTRRLVAAWALAWSEVSADLQDTLLELLADGGTVSRATMLRSLRLRVILSRIASSLERLASHAGVVITSDLAQVVDQAARTQERILAPQLPDAVTAARLLDGRWTVEDDDALARIVERTTEQITSLTNPLSGKAYTAVRRELIRSIAVGSSPRVAARRMVQRAEGEFNGGLSRALTIARTEMLDAHRDAAKHGQDKHTDVLLGWTWLCHLSPRTCGSCLVKHGTIHPPTEAGPDDHQCGRCARMPLTKPWADLGLDLEEPASVVPDGRAWFEALTDAEQIEMLGRRRWELLTSGAIEWDDLATLKQTAGWRDSWHVTPVKRLVQISRGRRARAS